MGSLISTIAALAGIAAFIGGLLLLIYAWDAWQIIPHELYLGTRPRWGLFRPVHLLAVAAVIHLIVRIGDWSGYFKVPEILAKSGDFLCLLFLAWWFIWAVRIACQKPTLDKELVRFAKYVCCGTGVFLITILAAILIPRR